MARRSKSRLAATLIAWLLLLGVGSALPAAAATTKQQGITLSPFVQQISIDASTPSKTFELAITNNTATLQELKLSARDFGSLNDTGGVLLEGAQSNYSQKYGLASWLTLEADTVNLEPGESKNVLVTIDNRQSLQPGGHYGAVVADVSSIDGQQNDHVAINQQLLSLMLLTKTGGQRYDLKLNKLEHNGTWLKLPSNVTLRFQNPGNVHVTPRGLVKLESPSGKVIAQGRINDESAYVLPESFRELSVPLTRIADAPALPGLYKIVVEYRYDGLDRVATKSFTLQFIDAGLYIVMAVFVIIGIGLFLRFKKRQKISTLTD